MKPDIVKDISVGFGKNINGYIGGYCECGRVLYIKNIPEKARQEIKIECPFCGFEMRTIYTREYEDQKSFLISELDDSYKIIKERL